MVEQRMVLTMSCERVDNIRDRTDAAAFNMVVDAKNLGT